jgi:hypothetical protein
LVQASQYNPCHVNAVSTSGHGAQAQWLAGDDVTRLSSSVSSVGSAGDGFFSVGVAIADTGTAAIVAAISVRRNGIAFPVRTMRPKIQRERGRATPKDSSVTDNASASKNGNAKRLAQRVRRSVQKNQPSMSNS